MRTLCLPLSFSLIFLSYIDSYSQAKPPSFYIDKGACPFEGCVYGIWKTKKSTPAYALPNLRSKRVGKFVAGSDVRAITGEVHSVPGRFVVAKRHGRYKAGDVLWTYTNLGEGYAKIWFNGKWDQEELGTEPPLGQTCQSSRYCWGNMTTKGKETWWIKIRSTEGWVGWTNQGENFCGSYEFDTDCKKSSGGDDPKALEDEYPGSARQIDFLNFTYQSSLCAREFGRDGIAGTVEIHNGEFKNEEAYFGVVEDKILYGDLTGDGRDEAIIHVGCGLFGANFGLSEIFIYTITNGRPTQLTELNDSDMQRDYHRYYPDGTAWRITDDGVRVRRGNLIIERFVDGPHCCPKYVATLEYHWSPDKLALVGKPRRRPFNGRGETD